MKDLLGDEILWGVAFKFDMKNIRKDITQFRLLLTNPFFNNNISNKNNNNNFVIIIIYIFIIILINKYSFKYLLFIFYFL